MDAPKTPEPEALRPLPPRDTPGEATAPATEQALREALAFMESIVETVREPLVVLDAQLRVVAANPSFYRTFQVTPGETEGRFLYDLGNRQWDIPRLRELLEKIIPEKSVFEDFEVEHDFPHIGVKTMLLNARLLPGRAGRPDMILLAIEDITERKRAQEALRRAY
ncbi:MAG: PAS domain-containing protein, partial [Syntrophobacterales bacterium]|nr:PAS domain-containing protein [Syntrophobacterales bacterium]